MALVASGSKVPTVVLRMAGTSLLVSSAMYALAKKDAQEFGDDLWGVALVAGLGVVLLGVQAAGET